MFKNSRMSSMKTLKLNTKKILAEMDRLGMNQTALAVKMGITRQRVHAILKTKAPMASVKIAKIFDLQPKDLII